MEAVVAQPTSSNYLDELNFGTLRSEDEYARYFAQLSNVFGYVQQAFQRFAVGGCDDSQLVVQYLSRILYSVQMLRMKYSYLEHWQRPLWVDLSESGFPNYAEIKSLLTDYQARDKKLEGFPELEVLKQNLVDHLVDKLEDPETILAQLGERNYLENLDLGRLVLPFTPGEIIPFGQKGNLRQYLYTWSCYDFSTNRPYVNILAFDQDASRHPLDQDNDDRRAFLEVLRGEGSRAPNVGILASAIDTSLNHIYPKILRRLCIGPLYSRLLLDGRPENTEDTLELMLRVVLLSNRAQDDDFIMFLTDEIVFSEREEMDSSIFAPWPRVRQIFAISHSDIDCYERGASEVNRYILLPHRLLQELSPEVQSAIPYFRESSKWTVDEQGGLHGV